MEKKKSCGGERLYTSSGVVQGFVVEEGGQEVCACVASDCTFSGRRLFLANGPVLGVTEE